MKVTVSSGFLAYRALHKPYDNGLVTNLFWNNDLWLDTLWTGFAERGVNPVGCSAELAVFGRTHTSPGVCGWKAPPVICSGSSDSWHPETGICEFLFNMIHCDHVNVFHKRSLNYHTINHTIIRVNGLIVTQNRYFLMELITIVILDQEKSVRNIPYSNVVGVWRSFQF